jgi:hypothetical protein
MIDLNPLAIGIAAIVLFVISTVYYSVFAAQLGTADDGDGRPPLWKIGVELFRSLTVATVVAGYASAIGITDLPRALVLVLSAWVAFPVVLLAGSVIWEQVPVRRAALHAGDWLLKLVAIGAIVVLLP